MHLIYESYLKYILWGKWNVFLKNWSEFELTFINKSKGDVRQQVLKRSFCLNYRFFPPGDNFNARSYSVGYNVIMAYSSAYIFKFFENCLFIFYLKQKWSQISLDLQDQKLEDFKLVFWNCSFGLFSSNTKIIAVNNLNFYYAEGKDI